MNKIYIYFILVVLFISMVSCTSEPSKILIIGDSISIGYTPFVQEILGEDAIVQHNPGNAQHTGTGLENVKEWIGEDDWDIVQFNWGLWDLCYRHPESKEQGKRERNMGAITFTPEEYRANLDSLVGMIKSCTKAKLIFVTTSYVPEGEVGRLVKDAVIYNEIAKDIMKSHKVQINDIYEESKEIHAQHSTATNNVHYTKEGYKALAQVIIGTY
ncbi:MAG: SGNH/GDSL hydrolase family protein [Bacteroidota bacterium]|nr:SGNH/GDSL hydrolase family protein [Bacteroidota bacterium]